MKITIAAAAFCIAALGAMPAAAATFPAGGVTAADVAAALKDQGLEAEISVDDWGDPLIKSRSGARTWHILFYDCDSRKTRCASYQFRIGLDLSNGITYARCNSWNDTKRFARCMLDNEMDPYLKWDLEAINGFTSEALAASVEHWIAIVPGFASFVRSESTT